MDFWFNDPSPFEDLAEAISRAHTLSFAPNRGMMLIYMPGTPLSIDAKLSIACAALTSKDK